MSIKRLWLNPTSSSDNGWMKYGIQKDVDGGYYTYSLTIADCTRLVNLNFDFDTKKSRGAARRKLILMENALIDMREQCDDIMRLNGEL